jgi:hypothetical protein
MQWLVLAGALFCLLWLTIRRARRQSFLSAARAILVKILDSPPDPAILADLHQYALNKGIRPDLDKYIVSLVNTEIDRISDLPSYQAGLTNLNNILPKLNFQLSANQQNRLESIKRRLINEKLNEFDSKLAFFTREQNELSQLLEQLDTQLIDQEKARIDNLKRSIINKAIADLEENYQWSAIEEIRFKLLLILLKTELTKEEDVRIKNLINYNLVVAGKYKPINCIFYAQQKESVFFETKAVFCQDRGKAGYFKGQPRLINGDKVVAIDNGDLLLTVNRILFKGRKGVLSLPLDRISNWDQVSDGVRIEIDTREREYFLFSDDLVLFGLLLAELRQYGADYGKNDTDGSYHQLHNNDLALGLCYEILGLNPAATKKEVIAAYRQRAKQYHPDVRRDEVNHDFFVVTQAKNKILAKIG